METVDPKSGEGMVCGCCNVPLETIKVTISYLKSTFPAEIPGCPRCGQVYIPEDLALGRMAEVERTLEDK
ncbi:MAG: hypothetical protein JW760_01715 [Spirochaetales bacterium]|nr:hypothetical protein [Spirochaetales bacterium]